jgi:hypothetical protein
MKYRIFLEDKASRLIEFTQESIVLSGRSTFLRYENSTFKTSDEIHKPSRILRPSNPEEYPYEPYEFSSIEEVNQYEESAKRIESFGTLFEMTLSIVMNRTLIIQMTAKDSSYILYPKCCS